MENSNGKESIGIINKFVQSHPYHWYAVAALKKRVHLFLFNDYRL